MVMPAARPRSVVWTRIRSSATGASTASLMVKEDALTEPAVALLLIASLALYAVALAGRVTVVPTAVSARSRASTFQRPALLLTMLPGWTVQVPPWLASVGSWG